MTPAIAADLHLVLTFSLCGCVAYLAWSRAQVERALAHQRTLTGQSRKPALTMVLPALPDAGDPLPRFRLTHLDGRVDPDGVVRPPPLPVSVPPTP